jgi:hypothetical protein
LTESRKLFPTTLTIISTVIASSTTMGNTTATNVPKQVPTIVEAAINWSADIRLFTARNMGLSSPKPCLIPALVVNASARSAATKMTRTKGFVEPKPKKEKLAGRTKNVKERIRSSNHID